MQKIKFIASYFILAGLATWLNMSWAVAEKPTAEKIKQLVAEAVSQEKKIAAENSREAKIVKNAGQKLDGMMIRLNTIENSLSYFSRFKKTLQIQAMKKGQDEIARACCPLRPRALEGQTSWMFKGRGNKLKGKTISGLGKDKSGKKGGRARKKGAGSTKE